MWPSCCYLIVTGIGLKFGGYWAALILLSGFVFVAPLLALGLYSVSRQEHNQQFHNGPAPTFARSAAATRHALGTAIGFATAMIGLAVIILLLGYATWHAYAETVDARAWPTNG